MLNLLYTNLIFILEGVIYMESTTELTLGKYIQKIRKEKNFSQRELAKKLDISCSELSRIEADIRKNPSPKILNKISLILDIPLYFLMEKADYITSENSTDLIQHYKKALNAYFYQNDYDAKLNTSLTDSFTDFVFTYNQQYQWGFNCIYLKSDTIQLNIDSFSQIVGRVVMSPNYRKFSIVVNQPHVYEKFSKYALYNLTIKFSVMLIDLDNHRIQREAYLN